MSKTFALDVYGTLIDPHAIAASLETHVGDQAARFSEIWRSKQLEYSFRRGLMGVYQDFSICTRQALDYTCQALEVEMPAGAREALMAQYRALPAFADVPDALKTLRASGHRLFAFSNGLPADLEALFAHAGLADHLDGIVSVHDLKSFKPDPRVYHYFTDQAGAAADGVWLVSSNPFDIIGARAVGWSAAWVQRNPKAVFDPFEFQPSAVVASLRQLADL